MIEGILELLSFNYANCLCVCLGTTCTADSLSEYHHQSLFDAAVGREHMDKIRSVDDYRSVE